MSLERRSFLPVGRLSFPDSSFSIPLAGELKGSFSSSFMRGQAPPFFFFQTRFHCMHAFPFTIINDVSPPSFRTPFPLVIFFAVGDHFVKRGT